jgi:hypothetical protein
MTTARIPQESWEVLWLLFSVMTLDPVRQVEILGDLPSEIIATEIDLHDSPAYQFMECIRAIGGSWVDKFEQCLLAQELFDLNMTSNCPCTYESFMEHTDWRRMRELAPLVLQEAGLDLWPEPYIVNFDDYTEVLPWSGSGFCKAEHSSGYSIKSTDWITFANCWEKASRERATEAGFETHPSRRELWIKRQNIERITDRAIVYLERRIRGRLTRSYRDFLLATRGQVDTYSLAGLEHSIFFSPESVVRFNENKPKHFDTWFPAMWGANYLFIDEDYFDYRNQFSHAFIGHLLDSALLIGRLKDEQSLLLIPLVVTADGEWEAWRFGPTIGAVRYPSFAHLIRDIALQDIAPQIEADITLWRNRELIFKDYCTKYISLNAFF